MIKILLNIILLYTVSFAGNNDSLRSEAKPAPFLDFGISGKVYPIEEPDMYDILLNAARDYAKDFNKTEVEDIITSEVDKRATFNDPSGSLCRNNSVRDWQDDYFEFKMDYYNPMGRLIYKKGDKMIAPSIPIEKHVCLIDATFMVEAINQINFFQKETNGNCVYLVSNRNVMELWKKFPTYDIYPNAEGFKKRFNVNCIPAKIDMLKTKIKVNYYSIELFKN